MGTAVKTSDLYADVWPKELPEGYEVRTSSISEAMSARFYIANAELGRIGVLGLSVEDEGAVHQEFNAAYEQVNDLIAGMGGEPKMGWRIRHTDGEIDFLAKKAEGSA